MDLGNGQVELLEYGPLAILSSCSSPRGIEHLDYGI